MGGVGGGGVGRATVRERRVHPGESANVRCRARETRSFIRPSGGKREREKEKQRAVAVVRSAATQGATPPLAPHPHSTAAPMAPKAANKQAKAQDAAKNKARAKV